MVRILSEILLTTKGDQAKTAFPYWSQTRYFSSGVYGPYNKKKWKWNQKTESSTQKLAIQRSGHVCWRLCVLGVSSFGPLQYPISIEKDKDSTGTCPVHPSTPWTFNIQPGERVENGYLIFMVHIKCPFAKINSLAVIHFFVHFVNLYAHYFKCTFIPLNYAEMFHHCPFYVFFSLPFGNNKLMSSF